MTMLDSIASMSDLIICTLVLFPTSDFVPFIFLLMCHCNIFLHVWLWGYVSPCLTLRLCFSMSDFEAMFLYVGLLYLFFVWLCMGSYICFIITLLHVLSLKSITSNCLSLSWLLPPETWDVWSSSIQISYSSRLPVWKLAWHPVPWTSCRCSTIPLKTMFR